MKYDKGDDLIKKLIKENKIASPKPFKDEDDIKEKLKNVNKDEAIKKLNEMGLGSIAQRLRNTSNEELIKMISQNPALLKKINEFLK